MAVSIKSYLKRKKAAKLPEDIRIYIENIGNNMKAVAILNIAYKLLECKEDVSVENIKKITDMVDKIYISDTDKYIEKYFCYNKLVMNYLRYNNKEKLIEISQIPYVNTDNQYFNEMAYYCHYHLIMWNVPIKKRNLIVRDLVETTKLNSDFYHNEGLNNQCVSIYREIINPHMGYYVNFGNINRDTCDFVNELINSKLVRELLESGNHLSDDSVNIKSKNVLLKLISKGIDEFDKDKNGFIILQERGSNYYKKYEDDFLNSKWCKDKIFVISDAQKYKERLLGNSVVFQDKPCYKVSFNGGLNSSGFTVVMSSHTYLTKTGEIGPVNGDTYQFFAYSQTEIFTNIRGKKRPVTLSDLVKITRYPFVQTYIEKIMDDLSVEYPFFKDFKLLYRESLEYKTAIIPISVNDVFKYHNWNEYFRDKYKTANELKYNFNKLLPMVSYALIKTVKYVKKTDIGLLYNMLTENTWIAEPSSNKEKNVILKYYLEKFGSLDEDIYQLLEDWIMMSVNNKIPISLRVKSQKKIAEKHDDLMIDLWEKQSKKSKDEILVKEDSKFNQLREILPPEYEWITTSKRLTLESKMQRHCVWQYDKKIKADNCAIYSYVTPSGIRHTIEFVYDRYQGYVIKQIQMFMDRGCKEGVEEKILKILEDSKRKEGKI